MRLLPGVAERRVSEVVTEPDRLDEVLVQAQRARHRPADLRHLERMRQPGARVVAGVRHVHLRLVLETAERARVDDAVAVALEGGPVVEEAALRPQRLPAGCLGRADGAERKCCILGVLQTGSVAQLHVTLPRRPRRRAAPRRPGAAIR